MLTKGVVVVIADHYVNFSPNLCRLFERLLILPCSMWLAVYFPCCVVLSSLSCIKVSLLLSCVAFANIMIKLGS